MVFGCSRSYHNVFWLIIGSYPIDMMNSLSWIKRSADLFLGHDSVFIGISFTICSRIARGKKYFHISVTRDMSTAPPVWVFLSW